MKRPIRGGWQLLTGIICAAICVGVGVPAWAATTADSAKKILIEAAVDDSAPEAPAIKFEVTNVSPAAVALSAASLPWEAGLFGVELFAFAMNSARTRIPELYLLADVFGTVELKPREKLAGKVQLIQRFPSLSKINQTEDILLFWTHSVHVQTDDKTATKLGRVGGMLVIPKRQGSAAVPINK